MKVISRKTEIKALLNECLKKHEEQGVEACSETIYTLILTEKVKFPLLEFCAHQLFDHLPAQDHLSLCDSIHFHKTEGGNVLLGIILQNMLKSNFDVAINKATEYISEADVWYVCDIIGERVFGYSLLHFTSKTLKIVEKLMKHSSFWVVRSLGAGSHYAVKKGLEAKYVETLFVLLISMAHHKNKEIRQGIGWAAKTTARFHPEIIEKYAETIYQPVANNWFRRKINIGLDRNLYATRNKG